MRRRNRLSKNKRRPRIKQEFFTNIPSDIIIDILSRLPVRTIISCKCVCKSWLNLLKTDEFVKFHLSKSVPGLAVKGQMLCTIFEFEDVLDLEHHDHHYNQITEFGCSDFGQIQGSANGLLFFFKSGMCRMPSDGPDDLYIINPMTEDYIQILRAKEFTNEYCQVSTYGFGASRITCQLKVVRITGQLKAVTLDEYSYAMNFPRSEVQVYTLRTGLWRSISPGPVMEYDHFSFGASLNGNLHWLVFDLYGCPWISCFDLEDELFSIFPSPPSLLVQRRVRIGLYAMEDCLCLGDSASDDEIVIWLLKDHEIEKSWKKEFVISKYQITNFDFEPYLIAYAVKVFKDGDILMACADSSVFYYRRKSRTTHGIDILEINFPVQLILHTSSFLSLRSFVKEKRAIVHHLNKF